MILKDSFWGLSMYFKYIINSIFILQWLIMPCASATSEKILLNIHSDSQQVSEQYTLTQLQHLPQHEIRTKIPWTNETHTYRGPYLEEIFTLAKIKGEWLTLYALDHYQVSFNFKKIKMYKPILALQVDSKPLTIRTKGPIWLILPMSDYKELSAAIYNDYMIWHLIKISIEEEVGVH